MNTHKVGAFDREEDIRGFVEACDYRLEQDLLLALERLLEDPKLRFFGLTGPTCSGKTTAAREMTEILEARGFVVHMISLDDFYYDKEYLHRRADADPNIEIDYDSEETLDIDCFQKCMEALLLGREAFVPHFDFEAGARRGGRSIRAGEQDVFLFEGIQILYPRVRAIFDRIPGYCSFAICPRSSIETAGETYEPNEIRLYRRLVRDYRHRATDVAFTAYLWESVRANEEVNIFPFLHLCHIVIDSTMPYEIGMLKPYLLPLLEEIPKENAFYFSAQRMMQKMQAVQPICADYMTENSLYKEFI